jgi:hypothetical protein
MFLGISIIIDLQLSTKINKQEEVLMLNMLYNFSKSLLKAEN